jgi:hypothetical protein
MSLAAMALLNVQLIHEGVTPVELEAVAERQDDVPGRRAVAVHEPHPAERTIRQEVVQGGARGLLVETQVLVAAERAPQPEQNVHVGPIRRFERRIHARSPTGIAPRSPPRN